MGVTLTVLAVFAALLCWGLMVDYRRRRVVTRSLPPDASTRARRDAARADQVRRAHLNNISNVPPPVAGDGISSSV